MKNLKISRLIWLLLIVTACQKKGPEETLLKAEDLIDLSYGDDSLKTMDVYLPGRESDTTKVIILLHGGSWFQGDKADSNMITLSQNLRDKGFAVANINYRLTHTTDSITLQNLMQEDLPEAVSYIVTNSRKWHISSEKIGMMGASAGAHLALLYTYAYNTDNKIKTVVSLAGPTNFTVLKKEVDPVQSQLVEWLLGTSMTDNPGAYVQGSPITHVNSLTKPTLIFHSKDDIVVPVQQSRDLITKLDQVNVRNKLIEYDNTGHDLITPANNESFLLELGKWFRLYLK